MSIRLALPKELTRLRPEHLIDRLPQMALSRHNARTRVEGTRVVCDPPRRKICIYGAGIGRNEAPLDDPTWCVWALNLCAPYDAQRCLRADVWWDLHQRCAQTADDLRWIEACPFPIYLPPDLMDASPRAVRYPLEEIEERYGSYWACTFAYMIAMVLFENSTVPDPITDLGLYGVELAYGTERERTVEWANTAYWLGRAEERGIALQFPAKSTLLTHPYRYGFEYQRELEAVKDYTNLGRALALEKSDIDAFAQSQRCDAEDHDWKMDGLDLPLLQGLRAGGAKRCVRCGVWAVLDEAERRLVEQGLR